MRTTSVQQQHQESILWIKVIEDDEEWFEKDYEWMENIDDIKEAIEEIDEIDDDYFLTTWRLQEAVPEIKYIDDEEESIDENTPVRLQCKLGALTHRVLLSDVWATSMLGTIE